MADDPRRRIAARFAARPARTGSPGATTTGSSTCTATSTIIPDLFDDAALKALPIVRLEGGRLVAAAEETIYLPPSEERVEESYGLKRFAFRIVSHAIIRRNPSPRKEEEKRLNHRTQAARSFLLERLEVKHHRPLEIVWNQVLPYLEDQTYESTEALQADFGLLLYIKEHWAQIQKDADETDMDVAAAFRRLPLPAVGARKKRAVKGVSEAYLPADLGGNPDLRPAFPGRPRRLVHRRRSAGRMGRYAEATRP